MTPFGKQTIKTYPFLVQPNNMELYLNGWTFDNYEEAFGNGKYFSGRVPVYEEFSLQWLEEEKAYDPTSKLPVGYVVGLYKSPEGEFGLQIEWYDALYCAKLSDGVIRFVADGISDEETKTMHVQNIRDLSLGERNLGGGILL